MGPVGEAVGKSVRLRVGGWAVSWCERGGEGRGGEGVIYLWKEPVR